MGRGRNHCSAAQPLNHSDPSEKLTRPLVWLNMDRLIGSRPATRPGSVLILAVWALFFLGALAVAVGSYVSSNIRVAVTVRRRTQAYALARAGVDLAATHVAANTNRWDGLTKDCWNCAPDLFDRNPALGEGTFSVRFGLTGPDGEVTPMAGIAGEEGKINLNSARRDLLRAFLEVVGEKEPDRAAEIAEAIMAWRETVDDPLLTHDKETQYYAGLDRPYTCHHGDFGALQELLLVRGVDAGLYAKILPHLTLFGSGKVNANTASPEVLKAAVESRGVRGADAQVLVDDMLRVRPRQKILDFHKELSDKAKRHFASVKNILTVRSTCFYGEAHGNLTVAGDRNGKDGGSVADKAERRIAFVVDEDGNTLYWHEH